MHSPEIDAIADVAPHTLLGDINGDGLVDGLDLGLLLAAWSTEDPLADIDGNGNVGVSDLLILIDNWGPC